MSNIKTTVVPKDIKTSVTLGPKSVGALNKLEEDLKKRVKEAVATAMVTYAATVESTAKELCPVDSGTLRDSIHTTFSKQGQFAKVRTDAKTAPHGHLVHFGTKRMEGTPFLFQAVEAHPKSELIELVKQELKTLE